MKPKNTNSGNKKQPLKLILLKKHKNMLTAMAKGDPDKAIAMSMGISLSTYDFHKRKLFKILKANSKPNAVHIAHKHNIICEHL